MASIPQTSLFSWNNIEAESDLKRLELVFSTLPDEKLMTEMEKDRGSGRNDFQIRPVWNSIIAGIVYEHKSIESLRRELKRNAQLRELCGFDVFGGSAVVPKASNYSRFLKNLLKKEHLIKDMFDNLVEQFTKVLPDFGERLAIDSKAIRSHSIKKNKNKKADGRRDLDANTGYKTYKGVDKEGKSWKKIKSWFGYKVHLLVDSTHELPIAYKVTKASCSDMNELVPLIQETSTKHEELINRAKYLGADKGYDSVENNIRLYKDYGIKTIIDIRQMWQDKEERPLYPKEEKENIFYDELGNVYCFSPEESMQRREMAYVGFEEDRSSIKYRCPAKAYGFKCAGMSKCPKGQSKYGKTVRIKIEEKQRTFVPVARSSQKWKREYKKRTAVERVNSRLDVSFGFEQHYIRGLQKMKVRMGLALVVMLAMGLGHVRAGNKEDMRSLVKLPKAA